MVNTGTRSKEEAFESVHKVMDTLREHEIEVPETATIQITNMVATGNFHGLIDLEAMDEFPNVMYEPEMFPGLIYRMPRPKVVMLLFSSGKIVCVGAKSKEMISEATIIMYNFLNENNLFFPNFEISKYKEFNEKS